MITTFNPDNKDQYTLYGKLFYKAYALLEENDMLQEKDKGKGSFSSLETYFSYIRDLISLDPVYAMLPLDDQTESIFSIDANTRIITIPSQFNKQVAIQDDQRSEIIVFTIDRYYDYFDLNNAKVCVQWINKNGEQGISEIAEMKDTDTYPGKLRLGWLLTSDVTAVPGPLQFALRFFVESEDDSSAPSEDGVKKTKYEYIFNTAVNTVNIKEGLIINNPTIEETDRNIQSTFLNYVQNSQNPSYKPAYTPSFAAEGALDLPDQTKIDEYDTLTLTASAIARDLGSISYKWNFIANGDTAPVTLTNETAGYEIGSVYVQVPDDETRKPYQRYYEKTEDGVYVPYFDEMPTDKTLYIERTSLKILESSKEDNKNVAGTYSVVAINTADDGVNSSQPAESNKCILPAPKEITFKDGVDLKDTLFIKDGEAKMSIELDKDYGNPDITYTWLIDKDGDESTAFEDAPLHGEEAYTNVYVAKDPGWYKVTIESLLNRYTETKESKVCKVTNPPAAPVLTAFKYQVWPSSGSLDEGNWSVIEEESNVIDLGNGGIVRLKVETDLDGMDPLKTDNLIYTWFVSSPDSSGWKEITNDMIDLDGNGFIHENNSNVNGPYLDVRCIENNTGYRYSCEVKNILSGVSQNSTYSKDDHCAVII